MFDVSGRLVDVLLAGEILAPGRHDVSWRGRSSDGGETPAGVYFYHIETEEFVATKRMTLVK